MASRRFFSSVVDKVASSKAEVGTALRRAFFYVPASNPRFLQKALLSPADTLVFDLEDGVAYDRKADARKNIRTFLEKIESEPKNASDGPNAEFCLRINGLDTGFEEHDLELLAEYNNFSSIALPKTHSAEELHRLSSLLDQIVGRDKASKLQFIPLIESARGILNLKEIVTADTRSSALVFAAEDFCADTGLKRTRNMWNLLYARSAIVLAAKSQGLGAIDAVCTNYKEPEVLVEECENGVETGFDGKQCIHPGQIEEIQRKYSPAMKDVEFAKKIVEARDVAAKEGRGAFTVDGKMVDKPVWLAAERLLGKAKRAGLI